ncbi:MAG: type I-B CRISPR-associated protein Cas7/Cst2/DevR [Stygiobacter sp.]
MARGLTFTAIFKAMSLNYGESLGNISELKKINSGDNTYSYMSRQAIRYELYKSLTEQFKMDTAKAVPLDKSKGVIQFKSEVNIKDYAEADLFGYMKTVKDGKSATRSAVVRTTPAVALEPFLNDIEFGTNKNFADRINENSDIFQFEHQSSLYSYTMTIDLDRVGKDDNDSVEIEQTDKYERVTLVLDAVQVLNREIKGRTENLNPLFVIGGVYDLKNPFFLNRIRTEWDKNLKSYTINTSLLESVLDLEFSNNKKNFKVSDHTHVGFVSGFWGNEKELDSIVKANKESKTITNFFMALKGEVKKHYGVE